ncbi:MAG: putative macrolide 2-phosphotransferase [Micrococcaceae bacterium]|nr:putative macrolide 2-phosphotransferase [Micrococcaceae bacterium]
MTPMELAAVASAAVPGLNLTACASDPDDAADFDAAMLLDADRKRWRVRSPKHPEASTRLETELLVLSAFSPGIRAELPFLMPTVAGTVRQGELTTFVYSHLSGRSRSVEELAAGGAAVATEIGAAMAAIHDLPQALVDAADLPSYTANEFRQRRLNELDQAATTGKIPAALLRRWEHAMEDVALWKFNPCVVHGDLHEDNILLNGTRVSAVTGWTDLRVGDPADDFAWLVAVHDQPFIEAVQKAYTTARKETPDRHLIRRAALSAEFALAQWLVKGIAAADQQMIDEAVDMLRTLEHDIATYGGQPITTEPEASAAPAVPAAPSAVTGSAAPAAVGTTAVGSSAVGTAAVGTTAGKSTGGSTAVGTPENSGTESATAPEKKVLNPEAGVGDAATSTGPRGASAELPAGSSKVSVAKIPSPPASPAPSGSAGQHPAVPAPPPPSTPPEIGQKATAAASPQADADQPQPDADEPAHEAVQPAQEPADQPADVDATQRADIGDAVTATGAPVTAGDQVPEQQPDGATRSGATAVQGDPNDTRTTALKVIPLHTN